jgi:hypothetical protein
VSWPHAVYLTVAVIVWLFAVATAWKSADNVISENRVWTRAWRIFVTFLAAGPSGWLVPFGAIYVIARYAKVWFGQPRTTA